MGFTISQHGSVSATGYLYGCCCRCCWFPFPKCLPDRCEHWCHPAAKIFNFSEFSTNFLPFARDIRHRQRSSRMFSASCHCRVSLLGSWQLFLHAQLKNLFFLGFVGFLDYFFLVFREFVWVSCSCFFLFLFSDLFLVLVFFFLLVVLHVV